MSGTALGPVAGVENGAESALIDRAVAGDRAAQDELVRCHLPAVYQLAYRLLGRRELAEDAVQEAMISAVRALPQFRRQASFRTWLLRIAANAARSQRRRSLRPRELHLAVVPDVASPDVDPGTAAERRLEARRVEAALAALPTKQRLAVTLRTQQGLSYAEIAEATGSTEGAARVNYHLGIRRLRELLT